MGLNAKNRYHAFGIHFLVSLLIVLNFAYLIFSHWYPEPFFTADGGWSIFRTIIMVDLVLGPVLTLLIFKPGKKGLKFDLSAIATVQIAALIYGGTILYQERPTYLTFSVDRFVLVSADDIDASKLRFPALLKDDAVRPLPVYAHMPEDPNERVKLATEVMQGLPDLEFRAEFYEPLSQNLGSIISKSKDISELKMISGLHKQKIESFLENHCSEGCGYFPLVGKKRDVILAISKKDGSVEGGIDVDPWGSNQTLKTANLES